MHQGLNTGLSALDVSPRQRLDDVVRSISNIPFGGTDCALPMLEAERNRWMVDVFVVYTDNETWAGSIHPSQALRRYRERTGIPARLVVVGMASNGFSIADPDDAGMLDVVGFDAAAPQLIADFAR
jgi:60 kDa SS-A/Ro ribonucleoprotein